MNDISNLIDDMTNTNFDDLKFLELESFGLMNSHVYRKMFKEIVKEEKLNQIEVMVIMTLTIAVKNKDRILNSISKFDDKKWYENVKRFFKIRTVQYPPEMNNMRIKVFPVVNIVHQNPSLAYYCYNFAKIDYLNEIPINNLFAAQMKLSKITQEEQKIWEQKFWNNTVKKSKGNKTNYLKGFNEEFYNNKASDMYPLIKNDGKSIYKEEIYNMMGYSTEDLVEYLTYRNNFLYNVKIIENIKDISKVSSMSTEITPAMDVVIKNENLLKNLMMDNSEIKIVNKKEKKKDI